MIVGYHADASTLAPKGWVTGSEWDWGDLYTDIVKTVARRRVHRQQVQRQLPGRLQERRQPVRPVGVRPDRSTDETKAPIDDGQGRRSRRRARRSPARSWPRTARCCSRPATSRTTPTIEARSPSSSRASSGTSRRADRVARVGRTPVPPRRRPIGATMPRSRHRSLPLALRRRGLATPTRPRGRRRRPAASWLHDRRRRRQRPASTTCSTIADRRLAAGRRRARRRVRTRSRAAPSRRPTDRRCRSPASPTGQLRRRPEPGDVVVDAAGLDGFYASPTRPRAAQPRASTSSCSPASRPRSPSTRTVRTPNDRGYECLVAHRRCAPLDADTGAARSRQPDACPAASSVPSARTPTARRPRRARPSLDRPPSTCRRIADRRGRLR